MEPWRWRINELPISIHVDWRILQNFTTAVLLYLLVFWLLLLLQGIWYGLFTERTRKNQQAETFSWQLRQASSKISRIHSYRSHKARKCCYAENELVIGVLSYWYFEWFDRSCTTKVLPIVEGRVVLSPVARILALRVFWTRTQYTTGRNFVS